jgi:flagellar biosynthesis protein FlhB
MSESEDRTQAPSARRRQEARERGQVAHSPELTAAAGLLAATVVLAARGESFASALLGVVRKPLAAAPMVTLGSDQVVALIRDAAVGVAGPVLTVLGAAAVGAFAAHQAQVRGVWAPHLLAPDPTRLWAGGAGEDLGTRAVRGFWSLAKAVLVVAVAAWVVHSARNQLAGLSNLTTPALARACGGLLTKLALTLAVATLALGFADFGLRWQFLESRLRLTQDESRQDLRSMEGDPALRARRRQLARSWRGDPAEALAGASLLLTGHSGLTVVLSGSPSQRISVRTILTGPAGTRLRLAAAPRNLPTLDAPDLSLRLARRRPPSLPLTSPQLAELTSLWPAATPNGTG